MALFPLLFSFAHSLFAPRLELMVEILALRQQLAILNRTDNRRPHPRTEPEEVLEELQFLFKKDPTRNLEDRKFERKKFNHSARLRFHRYRKRISA
jgi:hypothetical protein